MDRHCRKCGNQIPHKAWIDGKISSLLNRVFCLECSPYKCHNTKSDDPARIVTTINRYKTWPKKLQVAHRARNIIRGVEIREKLIELAGGKCIKCGYCKCQRSMNFHHRDPTIKKFSLVGVIIRYIEWDKLIEEIHKCDLLCSNCHGEEEDKISRNRFLENYTELQDKTFNKWSDILREIGKTTRNFHPIVQKTCPVCSKHFNTRCEQTFCSNQCRGKMSQSPKKPSKEELEIWVINEVPWEELGRKFEVSGSAVKKWARKYGIEFKARR